MDFFIVKDSQQLLIFTVTVCLTELSLWAGRQSECPCSCQQTMLILQGQLSQAITRAASSCHTHTSPPSFLQLLITSQSLQQAAHEITVHPESRAVHIQSIYYGKTIHNFPLKDFFLCWGTNGLYVMKKKTVSFLERTLNKDTCKVQTVF